MTISNFLSMKNTKMENCFNSVLKILKRQMYI